MPVAPVRLLNRLTGESIDSYAVLDTAAEFNLCAAAVTDMLNINGDEVLTSVIGATGAPEDCVAQQVKIAVRGYHSTAYYDVDAYALPVMTDLQDHIPCPADLENYSHLRGITLPDHERKKVDLLIGIGESALHHVYDTRCGGSDQLWAALTGLGWVLHGRDSKARPGCKPLKANPSQVHHTQPDKEPQPDDENRLLRLIEQHLALDFNEPQHSTTSELSVREREILKVQQDSVKRLPSGRYEISMLWKKSPSTLPNNRSMAYSSLQSLGKKLMKNPTRLSQYKSFIDGMVASSQAESAPLTSGPPVDLALQTLVVWYLLHHDVGPKFRVVFNGAAAFSGHSLNSCLHKGPEHTSTLLGSLIRWRAYSKAASGDIKGMFYNVSLPPAERDTVRFLWWMDGDPTKPVTEYRLSHQVPGLTCSPSNACYILRQAAHDNPTKASAATIQSVMKNFYVDDWLPSEPDSVSLQRKVDEMRQLCAAIGFRLTKFTANDQSVLANVPLEDRAPVDDPLEPGATSERKILGIHWDPNSDDLKIYVEVPSQPATRRGILSAVMSPFDPCGLALPYLLEVKLLLQRLFKLPISWDDSIPPSEEDLWNQWVAELPSLETVSCRRALIPRLGYKGIYLCTFADASQKGYAACSYVVCDYENGSTSRLCLGKVRVAPGKKMMTIPRLELMAAVLAARIADAVKKEFVVKFDGCFFWTDSITVLHWVKNPELRLKAFVANRVAKVVELTASDTWSHVRTDENPADIGSRGIRPSDHTSISMWHNGPSFLLKGKSQWPITDGPDLVLPAPKVLELKVNLAREREPVATHVTCDVLDLLFERYSTLRLMVAAAGWWLRFRKTLWCKIKKLSLQPAAGGALSVEELDEALLALLRAAQWAVYPNLMQSFSLSSTNLSDPAKQDWYSLRQLDPYLDEHGLLRVGGRLHRAGLSYGQTHPLIVPRRHPFTNLLIRKYHVDHRHVGFGHVLALLQERYWIVGGSGTVRHYLHGCVPCRHAKAPLGSQKMAPLPASRFKINLPAFSYSAVDYFGPLTIKLTTRKSEKRWGCLITCLTSRAVHIDVVDGLDTKQFLMAFRRFISVYGPPKEMISDNGANFTSADVELKAEFKRVNLDRIAQGLKPQGVDFRWSFNPPAASHQGGVFERMIGATRRCLRWTMKDLAFRRPSDSELRTILKEIEGIINSRPLTPCGTDPSSYDVITPAQLLRPGICAVPQQTREYTSSDVLRGAFKASQWHAQCFWERFKQTYIPMLQKRVKWFHPKRNFKVGDLVHVEDKTAPRMQWPLALITEVFPNSSDGLVRRVMLRFPSGKELRRDVRHICLLEAAVEAEPSEIMEPVDSETPQSGPVTRSTTRRAELLRNGAGV